MIQRREDGNLLCVPQPSHAWMAGRMAEEWHEPVEPHPEVCLGAAQHDCGWIEWEESPTLNAATGGPHDFTEMETGDHLAIWTRGPRRVAIQSRFAGLVVSLHGTGLYGHSGRSGDPTVRAYLESETAWQTALRESLARDPRFEPCVTDEALGRTRKLVAAWDLLSLHLCRGVAEPKVIEAVPFGTDTADLRLAPAGRPNTFSLSPWPFRARRVTFRCEAYRIAVPFEGVAALREAIRTAPRFSPTFSFEAE